MSIQTATNRFIVPPKAKSLGFYQELLRGVLNYEQLGNKLIEFSEQARALRQFDALSEYALVLSNLPVEKLQTIGQYYLALSFCRIGRGELGKAQTILEKVASVAPLRYRAEAMVSLSSVSWDTGQPCETLRYCLEAIKISEFSLITIKALRGIAVLKSFEGFHRSALQDLENLYPIMKYAPPHIYFDYFNSLAVELAECGRLEEATNVSKMVCSSPLVSVYPEWRDTHDDILLKGYKLSRSVVSFARKNTPQNVVRLPEPEPTLSPHPEPARILHYSDWKNKMVKEPNGDQKDKSSSKDKSERELFFELTELISKRQFDKHQLQKLIDLAEKISSEPRV